MNVVYCFIGPLPSQTYTTVKQTRMFFDGPIYLITNDMTNDLCTDLVRDFQILLVNQDDVIDADFQKSVQQNLHRFRIVSALKERSKLFIQSFERFFCLQNLMAQLALQNVFFMELDNLIQKNPMDWMPILQKHAMAYMWDGPGRQSSGVAWIRDLAILEQFTDHCLNFIAHTKEFLSEMAALASFARDQVQILPTHGPSKYPNAHENQTDFHAVFDAASQGIYLGGLDPVHTRGKIQLGSKSQWSAIDATKYKYEWRRDEKGRNVPYVFQDEWIALNNLHIHSKNLEDFTSE